MLKPEDLTRAASGYAKRRINGETFSATRENAPITDTKNIGGPQDDKASTLTLDKLRKFNDINGYD